MAKKKPAKEETPTEKLLAAAKAAADKLTSDTSCSQAETREALEDLRDHVNMRMDSLDEDDEGADEDD